MEMRVNNGYTIDDMVVIEKTGICIVQHEKYRKASAYYLFSFLHCAKVQIFCNPAMWQDLSATHEFPYRYIFNLYTMQNIIPEEPRF